MTKPLSEPSGKPIGRPNEYKPKYVQKVDEYLKICQDRKDKKGLKVKLPTLEGFSLFVDVSMNSLENWSKDNPDFLRALNGIKKIQKERLLNMGLSGDYNSTIAKLILSANHGMSELQRVGNADGSNLKIEILKYGNDQGNIPAKRIPDTDSESV